MLGAADDLAALYADLGETVCRLNGAPDFLAMSGIADDDVFGGATSTDRQIRYMAGTTLFAGESLVIDGRTYKVTKSPPRRMLDGREFVADLVLA